MCSVPRLYMGRALIYLTCVCFSESAVSSSYRLEPLYWTALVLLIPRYFTYVSVPFRWFRRSVRSLYYEVKECGKYVEVGMDSERKRVNWWARRWGSKFNEFRLHSQNTCLALSLHGPVWPLQSVELISSFILVQLL